MKKVRKKKFIGAALNLVGTIGQTAVQAITAKQQMNQEKEMMEQQMNFQREMMNRQMNQQNSMAFVNSMNQAYNKDMSGNYNKYQHVLKLGGKRVKVKNLSKYKSRF